MTLSIWKFHLAERICSDLAVEVLQSIGNFALPLLVCFLLQCHSTAFESVLNKIRTAKKLPQVLLIQEAKEQFQILAVHLDSLNEWFAYINLLFCVRELVTAVALIGYILRLPEENGSPPSQESINVQGYAPVIYGYSTIMTLNALIRYGISISLNEMVGQCFIT